MSHLVDFIVCWMLLSPEARRLVYDELGGGDRPRVWRLEGKDVLVIGA